MADVKPKALYTDRLNPKYAGNPNADRKRQQAEAFETLNHFVRKHGGAITSPPGDKTLRVEAPKGSELPARLRELGFAIVERGTVTRITGAQAISPKVERLTRAVPSAFAEMDVLQIRLDGR